MNLTLLVLIVLVTNAFITKDYWAAGSLGILYIFGQLDLEAQKRGRI